MSANSDQTTLGRSNAEADSHTTGAPYAQAAFKSLLRVVVLDEETLQKLFSQQKVAEAGEWALELYENYPHHLLYVKLGFELDSTRHTEVQSLDPAFDKTVSRIAAENISMNKGPLNIYQSK